MSKGLTEAQEQAARLYKQTVLRKAFVDGWNAAHNGRSKHELGVYTPGAPTVNTGDYDAMELDSKQRTEAYLAGYAFHEDSKDS
jgi:hypothetical protein